MGSGGRIAAAVAGGLLTGAGKAYEITAEQRFKEKLLKLENERRQTERQEDRDQQNRLEGERQFSQLSRDTMQIKADERRSAAADERAAASESSAERRHRETLEAGTSRAKTEAEAAGARTNMTQAQLVRKKDGSLVWSFPDGTSKPAMDGDKPLDGEPVRPGAKTDEDDAGLFTVSEKRTIDTYENSNKDAMGKPDRAKVIKILAKDNPKLAAKYAGEPVNAQGMTQSEARKAAEAEARKNKGFFTSREKEFPQDAGDPAKFIERRTAEIMSGKTATAAEPGSAMASEGRPKPLGNAFWTARKDPDLLEPGNIDLTKRPSVDVGDGTRASVRTKGFNFDGVEVNIPTVSDDGRLLSDQEAVEQYRKTGKHLGKYRTKEGAARAAEALHLDQEAMGYGEGKSAGAERPPKPTQYPNAQWSDKEGAWVVKQGDTWYAVE